MEINGKNVVVTGGLGSLGSSIVTNLEQAGANVYVFDCRQGERERDLVVDVTDENSVLNAIDKVGQIDILINCAGEIYSEPVINVLKKERHAKESWDRVINNNLNSCFVVSSCVAQRMAEKRTKGIIINFSSISAKGNMGQVAYSAAKAGIEAMTRVMAKELGMFKIRVCAIAPGFIETPSTHEALSESMVSFWKQNTPLRKLGSMQDIVSTVNYIIENDYLSGTTIQVDGGLSI